MEKIMQGNSNYVVNSSGYVSKITKNGLKKIKSHIEGYGFQRINIKEDGTVKTKLLHTIVYETFKNKEYSRIVFLDGDKTNCSIENLISVEELIDYYNKK